MSDISYICSENDCVVDHLEVYADSVTTYWVGDGDSVNIEWNKVSSHDNDELFKVVCPTCNRVLGTFTDSNEVDEFIRDISMEKS
jgi:hypothetical protein